MRALSAALLIAAVSGLGARAETSQQKGKRIIDEAVAALGGQVFLHMRNRVESGRIYGFYHGNLSGMDLDTLYTTYLDHPNPPVPGFLGERVRDARGKKQDDVILYTGDSGYEITYQGARPLADDIVSRFRLGTLSSIFYILRERLGEPGLIFDSRGSDFFENRPIEIVDIIDAKDRTVTVYFDQMNKLPVRQSYERRDPVDNQRVEEVSIYGKYRDVGGGVMWPFNIRHERNGDKVFEMFTDNVEINQDLSDSQFALPPDMKILKKEK